MVNPSHHKNPLSSLHIFLTMNKTSPTTSSTSTSSSSSSITTMKIKSVIHNLIFSHICRIIRALSKAKSVILEVFRENQLMYLKQSKRKNKYRKKILFGSFRLHYNWCSSSSHVLPIPSPMFEGISTNPNSSTSHIYYDSTWNSVYSTDDKNRGQDDCNVGDEDDASELSSYLQWLEEKGAKHGNLKDGEENNKNEIDKLADMFIADCHEKFRLEKIESYRRYQELIARFM
ncbi:uncharacterized protein LOC141642185 [Silene latifolia]|uniref:uncharacterized protein LOC141642185 n=1 Tax=Silene latifolia TaxID=37657 RepID=UPI003D77C5D9